ncbi:MAG: hypothetical protein GXY77_12510 [Fibrobacter sp.]|nr:hypothetical protein [Fibrobacter sp.]
MRVFISLVITVFLFGCSNDNEIKISNLAQGDVFFNFRAKKYVVVGNGGEITIDEIPNGSFEYATTFSVPAGASFGIEGDAGAGLLEFEKSETRHLLIYSSTFDDGNYTLYVNKTSSKTQSSKSPTSP